MLLGCLSLGCIFFLENLFALQDRLIPETQITTYSTTKTIQCEECDYTDYAIPANSKACKNCCPRPKATVTVTSTAYETEVCTHTISRDRTQFTTVRFTNTISTIVTRTNKINFINTTTIIGSRQVTTFHTILAVSYKYFTLTSTVFTSWALATAQFTTRVPTTRTTSRLVIQTLTVPNQSVLTIQTLVTVPTTLFQTLGGTIVTAEIVTSTVTSTSLIPDFVPSWTQYQDSPVSITSFNFYTESSLLTNIWLNPTSIGLWISEVIEGEIFAETTVLTTFTATEFTGTIVVPATSVGTITFSRIYPPPPIPPGYIWP